VIASDGAATFSSSVSTTLLNITGGSQLGQDYAYFKSNSTSNASLTLRKDSSGADSIDFLQLRNNANGLIGKIEGDGAATFANGLTLTDGNLVVASGHGIDFAATSGSGTSELLDDYEEGTWTPGITHGTTVATVTDLGASGSYTKVGRLVTLNGNVKVATVNGNGAALLTGFPFTVADTVAVTGVESNGIIGYYANWGDNVNSLILTSVAGTTYADVFGNHNADGVNATATTITQVELDATAEFRFSIQFFST